MLTATKLKGVKMTVMMVNHRTMTFNRSLDKLKSYQTQ